MRRRSSQHALHVAFAVQDVQRKDLVVESVGIIAAAIMELADRIAPMAGVVQTMPPRRRRAPVRERIVPVADRVHIAPGGEARPARHADGAIAVGMLEQRAAARQGVEVGRAYDGIAIGAEYAAAVLVGHDEKYVMSLHVLHRFHCSVRLKVVAGVRGIVRLIGHDHAVVDGNAQHRLAAHFAGRAPLPLHPQRKARRRRRPCSR